MNSHWSLVIGHWGDRLRRSDKKERYNVTPTETFHFSFFTFHFPTSVGTALHYSLLTINFKEVE